MPCRRARRGDRQVCRSRYDPSRAHPAHSLRLTHAVALYLTHRFLSAAQAGHDLRFSSRSPAQCASGRPRRQWRKKKTLPAFLDPRAHSYSCVRTRLRGRKCKPILLVCSPRRIFDSKTYIQASWITAPRATIVHPANQSATPKSSYPSRPPCSVPRTARLAVRAPSPRG